MSTLELVAAAVAGRAVALEGTPHGVHTDGSTIFLPTGATEESTLLRAVVCQASLIASGSLAPSRMRRLGRAGSAAAERYLALEVVRSCAGIDARLPGGPGRAVAAYAAQVGVTSSADESLDRALAGRAVAPPPAWFGELRPRVVLRGGGPPGEAPTDAQLAEALQKAMEPDADDEGDGSGERSRLAELLSSPVRNPLGSALLKMLGAQRSACDAPGGGNEVATVGRRSGVGNGRTVPRAPAPLVDMGGQLVRGHAYPEWDHRRNAYREDWCTVGEFDPAPGQDSTSQSGRPDTALLRELARLGLTYRPHDREQAGDEIDLGALVDHRVDLAAGVAGVPRVYRAERRTQQELGVLVLLDATGSTAEQQGATSVFEAQRRLALVLTTTLDQLGVRLATYAFYSRGRGNVRFLRGKSFDERWGLHAQQRLVDVAPTGFTRLGAALRHGTHVLDAQSGTQRRLLVVVGDGIPYDDGYEGRYALADSRRAVDEAALSAVGCVGLSATASRDGEAIWPEDAHRVVADPADLARVAGPLFTSALRRAAHRSSLPRTT